MFHSIDDFINLWGHEGNSTQKVLDALTDESLNQQVTADHRTLGRLAWHVVTSLDEMLSRTGLKFEGAKHDGPVPTSAKEIAEQYRTSNENMVAAIKAQWTDDSLKEVDDMYGEKWPKGLTLSIINSHQIHHRGQMTVLMRQAGLRVPGVYGPSLEEWGEHGMEAPTL
ncbi:hypothetical protein F7731_17565 [Cytobacillus depressus]|uniref:Damage-inducible protein DinB n=1 Tax=Cytobacillus depressus TaxID=1602942 RepID=A0A6L3V3B7_9BACI|nr:DinB family protein [Cytobacillus depressus]KAB2332100.1 hypothetical protein F7731_17565 [Cytobacillus depressus]